MIFRMRQPNESSSGVRRSRGQSMETGTPVNAHNARNGHFITLSLWTALILLLAILQGFAIIPSVNADALYSLTFVSEIFSSSSPFVWFIQPANGFFPD